MKEITERKQGYVRWDLMALITVAAAAAWLNRFVQDDAFISFRYARHLAEGNGLVWNVGERVEGYTNFLWTVCMTPAFRLGVDVVAWSYTLSLTAFVITLWCAWKIAVAIWSNACAGYLTVALLGANASFSGYATGGLETQFVTAWATAAVWLILRWKATEGWYGWLIGASLASAGAVMTRMDAILIIAPLWILVVAGRRRLGTVLAAGSIGLIPVAAWLIWRHAYYGAWVPNTFLVKIGGGVWVRGLAYVGLFYFIYGYAVAGIFYIGNVKQKVREPAVISLVAAVALWHIYVIVIGGDFMEFRMMVPSFPLVVALLSGGILAARRKIAVTVGLLLCGTLQMVASVDIPCMSTRNELKEDSEKVYKVAAEALNKAFGNDKRSIKIGVCAAGIIPFYTEMPSLDLLGLNDRDVALHGDKMPALIPWLGQWPGHVRIATGRQVLEKGVHLLLNKPWVISAEELKGLAAERVRRRWDVADGMPERYVAWRMPQWENNRECPVVAWPCGKDRYLITLYVQQNGRLEEAIHTSGAYVLP